MYTLYLHGNIMIIHLDFVLVIVPKTLHGYSVCKISQTYPCYESIVAYCFYLHSFYRIHSSMYNIIASKICFLKNIVWQETNWEINTIRECSIETKIKWTYCIYNNFSCTLSFSKYTNDFTRHHIFYMTLRYWVSNNLNI